MLLNCILQALQCTQTLNTPHDPLSKLQHQHHLGPRVNNCVKPANTCLAHMSLDALYAVIMTAFSAGATKAQDPVGVQIWVAEKFLAQLWPVQTIPIVKMVLISCACACVCICVQSCRKWLIVSFCCACTYSLVKKWFIIFVCVHQKKIHIFMWCAENELLLLYVCVVLQKTEKIYWFVWFAKNCYIIFVCFNII